jgi:hypothetical protein
MDDTSYGPEETSHDLKKVRDGTASFNDQVQVTEII